jgi:hypothetical protein
VDRDGFLGRIIMVDVVSGKKLGTRASRILGLAKRKPLTIYGTAAKKEKMPANC